MEGLNMENEGMNANMDPELAALLADLDDETPSAGNASTTNDAMLASEAEIEEALAPLDAKPESAPEAEMPAPEKSAAKSKDKGKSDKKDKKSKQAPAKEKKSKKKAESSEPSDKSPGLSEEKKAKEPKEKKAKEKKAKEPKPPRVNATTMSLTDQIRAYCGENINTMLALNGGKLTDAEVEERLKSYTGLPVKQQLKVGNLFKWLAGRGALRNYTAHAVAHLQSVGSVDSAGLRSLYLSKGLKSGTINAQTQQMMHLLPLFGVADTDGKTLTLRKDSVVADFLAKNGVGKDEPKAEN